MEKNNQILSDIVVFNKYAKHLPEENRRENWEEIVERYLKMLTKKYPNIAPEIAEKIQRDNVLAIRRNWSRIFCAETPCQSTT